MKLKLRPTGKPAKATADFEALADAYGRTYEADNKKKKDLETTIGVVRGKIIKIAKAHGKVKDNLTFIRGTEYEVGFVTPESAVVDQAALKKIITPAQVKRLFRKEMVEFFDEVEFRNLVETGEIKNTAKLKAVIIKTPGTPRVHVKKLRDYND